MPELRNPAVAITDPELVDLFPHWDPRGGTAPLSVEEKRLGYRATVARAGTPESVEATFSRSVPGPGGDIPVRIYKPKTAEGQLLPVLLYIHGGGFVSGDLDTHDPICRIFANRVPAIVVAVDYRLAPEHRYPAAHDDCFAVLLWLERNAGSIGGRADRLFVAGDSAGGGLTAALGLRARAGKGPAIAALALIYPMLDATLSSSSLVTNALIPPFTLTDCVHVWQQYLPEGTDRLDPQVSPLFVSDLSGLPPTFVITAGLDILSDEGQRYVERLQAAGVPTKHEHFTEMVHGFFQWGGIVMTARTAIGHVVRFLQFSD